MKKKYFIGFIFVILLILAAVLFVRFRNDDQSGSNTNIADKNQQDNFLLPEYPIAEVPLYQLVKIDSSKIFVNNDPDNLSLFGDVNFAYFNVVFRSEATQETFLDYYRNLFDQQITEEFDNSNMVKGIVGPYRLVVYHYGEGTGYIQVYIDNNEILDKYFNDFPKILEVSSSLVEHERSYGLLNQSGGEIEFTKYFTVINSGDQNNDGQDDVDEFAMLEEKYKTQYQNEQNFIFNDTDNSFSWHKEGFDVSLTLSSDHGRVYLMLRKNFDDIK